MNLLLCHYHEATYRVMIVSQIVFLKGFLITQTISEPPGGNALDGLLIRGRF